MIIATLENSLGFIASFISPARISEAKLKTYYSEIPSTSFRQVEVELPVLSGINEGLTTYGSVICHELGTPVLEMAFNSEELENATVLHNDGRLFGLEFNGEYVSGRTPKIKDLTE